MNQRVEQVLSIIMAVTVVVVAAVVVRREMFGRESATTSRVLSATPIEGWRDALAAANELGNSASQVKVIIFNDLECGGCRRYHSAIVDSLIKDKTLSISFVHRPLSGHRFARIGAIAAECASVQGRFAAFVDKVFEKQDSIGLKSWGSYARDVGVANRRDFESCVAGERTASRVQAGIAVAESFMINATPTIMINQWLFNRPLGGSELSAAINAIRAGREPTQPR